MASEQDMQGAIAAVGSAVDTFGTELVALKTAIDALVAKLGTAGIPDADIQALSAIGASLGTANTALQAAVDQATEAAK